MNDFAITALLLAGGAYRKALLYLPVALMLIGLTLRGVAFDFRVKAQDRWKPAWDRAFFAGSLLAAASRAGLPTTGSAKALGALCFVLTAVLATRLIGRLVDRASVAWVGCAVGASCTVAVWSVSGLENPLIGLLVTATALLLVQEEQDGRTGWRITAQEFRQTDVQPGLQRPHEFGQRVADGIVGRTGVEVQYEVVP